MTHGRRIPYSRINFEPPYDPAREAQTNHKIEKTGLIAGAAATPPALLYTRGLRREGVPLRRVPQVLKRDIAALKTHEVAPGQFKYGTLGSITGTMREGATGVGGDIAGAGRRVWSNVKGAWGGLTGVKRLSAKLDSIINFEEVQHKHHLPGLATLYGAGAITGAGVATGSKATRVVMSKSGHHIQRLYEQLKHYYAK